MFMRRAVLTNAVREPGSLFATRRLACLFSTGAKVASKAAPVTEKPNRAESGAKLQTPREQPWKEPKSNFQLVNPETLHNFYFVRRTANGNLPVYRVQLDTNTRTPQFCTLVTGISGDAQLLRRDLAKALGMAEATIKLNAINNNLLIKTKWHAKVRNILGTVF
ncbi:mitochondrial 54S ribosomal protein mL49 [Limtongia smithiae]|uniref:mitochondrial 54S ribosomal protein mL49 n=1 Tax=Limtongia smithiae TaxID=1125753 RepID=UPI0034CFD90E